MSKTAVLEARFVEIIAVRGGLPAAPGARPPPSCSPKGPPSPSWPATARRPPAASRTCSSRRSPSAGSTSWSWPSAATPSWRASASRASSLRSSRPRSAPPSPSRSSRTSTCPTSRSGAPAPRSRARRGSSRWPTPCSPRRRHARRPEELAAPFVDAGEGGRGRRGGARRRARHPGRAPGRERRARAPSCAAPSPARAVLRVRVLPGKEKDPEAAVYRDYFEHDEPGRDIPSHRLLAILRGEREGFLISDLQVDDEREVQRLGRSWGLPLEHRLRPARSPTPPPTATSGCCGRRSPTRCAPRCASAPRPRRSPSSAPTSKPCCSRRRSGWCRSWGSTPASAPAASWRWSTAPAGWWRPTSSTPCRRMPTSAARPPTVVRLIERARRPRRRGRQRHRQPRDRGCSPARRSRRRGSTRWSSRSSPRPAPRSTRPPAWRARSCPTLDVTLRGAVSIARRLQDPLAELVKIEPRSLGVGQYQHDVDQKSLERELDTAVEGAVNRVGRRAQHRLGAAAAARLRPLRAARPRGRRPPRQQRPVPLAPGAAQGRRLRPQDLRAVGRLPAHARTASNPLDRTAVHPERYAVVAADGARTSRCRLEELVGNPALVAQLDFSRFADDEHGLGRFTLEDIRTELLRPGRDPRPEFKTPEWRADVTSVKDLAARHGARGAGLERHQLRRLRRHRRPPRRPGARLRAHPPLRGGPARGGAGRGDRQGQGAGGRPRARAHRLSIKALQTPAQATRPPQRTGSAGRTGDARPAPRQDPRPEPRAGFKARRRPAPPGEHAGAQARAPRASKNGS